MKDDFNEISVCEQQKRFLFKWWRYWGITYLSPSSHLSPFCSVHLQALWIVRRGSKWIAIHSIMSRGKTRSCPAIIVFESDLLMNNNCIISWTSRFLMLPSSWVLDSELWKIAKLNWFANVAQCHEGSPIRYGAATLGGISYAILLFANLIWSRLTFRKCSAC